MKRNALLACVCAGALSLATLNAQAATSAHSGSFKTPTWVKAVVVGTFLCAGGIIGAAFVKNSQQNKPLTAEEATSCGWRFWIR